MNSDSNSIISIEQFVNALIKQNSRDSRLHEYNLGKAKVDNYMHYGYHAGWLEYMDIVDKDEPLLRKHAARIVHEFMRIELQEPDLEDVSAATRLRDLYDCRVCTKHVMQVFAKGIIDGYYATDTLYLFGMNEAVTWQDSDIWALRIFHPNNRIPI